MYVESVSMTDFRCFEKAETMFVYPGVEGLPKDALKNVTLLIGINGAGKTSLLKAVALGVLAPALQRNRGLLRIDPVRIPLATILGRLDRRRRGQDRCTKWSSGPSRPRRAS